MITNFLHIIKPWIVFLFSASLETVIIPPSSASKSVILESHETYCCEAECEEDTAEKAPTVKMSPTSVATWNISGGGGLCADR